MADTIIKIADAFDGIIRQFNSVDSLSQATKDISVEHARNILEKLRFKTEDEDSDAQERDIDGEKLEITKMLLQAAKAFLGCVAEIARQDRAKLDDAESSPIFERAVDAIGKASRRVRMDVIQALIRQGKPEAAQVMRVKMEAETPKRFKADNTSLAQLVSALDAGLTHADLLAKKIAAGLELQQWQNLPPSPPLPKKDKVKDKAHDIAISISGYHTIVGVSEKSLIPAVQEVNVAQEGVHSIGQHKVAEVSEKKLVPAAQEANLEQDKVKNDALAQNNQHKG